jgi:hypothetical protein
MEMGLVALILVLIVVSVAFGLVFRRQNKDLNEIKKISGRGGDFHE